MKTLKHLDLFSGIGGFALGLERAGFETVAFCEIEEYPRKVLKKHWPDIPIYKDIRELTGDQLRADGIVPDIITGGYPCQPFSQAGKRRGQEDDRHLWPEMFRLVKECRPAWVIGENVAGHISMGVDDVLSDLEAKGYTCRTYVIPACAVDAPHRRDRVWIVANVDRTRQHSGSRDGGRGRNISRHHIGGCGGILADANSNEQHGRRFNGEMGRGRREGKTGKDYDEERNSWSPEPRFCQFLDGLSQRLAGRLNKPISHCIMCKTHMENDDGQTTETRPREILQRLRGQNVQKANEWSAGRFGGVSQADLLQPSLHGGGNDERQTDAGRTPKEGRKAARTSVRGLRDNEESAGSPYGSGPEQQCAGEPEDAVQVLSHFLALGTWETSGVDFKRCPAMQRLRDGMAEIETWHVPETLSEVQEIWRSADDETKHWWALRVATGSPFCAEWPGVPRIAKGVANRVDRLKGLGNAVVPQIVEVIGNAILQQV